MPKENESGGDKKLISSHYKIEDGKLKRILPFCDRCGPGYFMADHGSRWTCGHCGFTKYKTTRTSNKTGAGEDY